MFSPKSFIVSGLTFISLIHFGFIFVYGVKECSHLFYMQLSSYPSTIYSSYYPFSIVYSCLLCCRLSGHRFMGLFLAFYQVPLIFISVFVPVLYYFDDFVVWCEVALTIQDLYIQIKKKMLLKLINLQPDSSRKKKRIGLNKIRNEKVKVKIDSTEIQRMIRDYYKKLYTNKMGNLE